MKKQINTDQAVQCLFASFRNYPVFVYLFPDSLAREQKLKYIFDFLVRLGLRKGEIISSKNGSESVSIWFDSDVKSSSIFDALKSGILKLFFHLGMKDFKRFMSLKDKKTKVRKEILKNNNYVFLDMLGVDPKHQGKGIASAIIKNKLKKIANEKKFCYLETSDIKNIDFYTKHGFKLIKEYTYDRLPVYCMIS